MCHIYIYNIVEEWGEPFALATVEKLMTPLWWKDQNSLMLTWAAY